MLNAPVQGQGQLQPGAGVAPTTQLNTGLQQQLNLEDVKHRVIDLLNAIARIRNQFETNPNAKWQDVLGQFSVVNVGFVNIVEDIKKVSKAFVIYPKNVNQENSLKLPVMLSTKLLPEMEAEETAMKEHVLAGISNQSIALQIEKLKNRIDAINAACACAEKAINDSRKVYGLGSRHTPGIIAPLDKLQAAKIEEQEKLLRAAVQSGEGLHLPPDQRIEPSTLPPHLESALVSSDADDSVGAMYNRSSTSFPGTTTTNLGAQHLNPATQPVGRSVPSPMTGSVGVSADNKIASPVQYANSPMSAANAMNVPSPQQQQRQKLPHIPQQSQAFQTQQLRPHSAHMNPQTHNSNAQEQQLKHQQERQAYNFASRQFLPGSAQQHAIGQNPSLQGMQQKHQLAPGSSANIYGGNQSFLPSQTFNVASMYPRNFSSQGFNVGASQGSANQTSQHAATNFPNFSNMQFGAQTNLPGIPNVPMGGAANISNLPNSVSNFNNIPNFNQNSLHGQANFSNIQNTMQNPNMGHHPRQPFPPQ